MIAPATPVVRMGLAAPQVAPVGKLHTAVSSPERPVRSGDQQHDVDRCPFQIDLASAKSVSLFTVGRTIALLNSHPFTG